MHLQRADHFRFVAWVQPRCGHRIDIHEPRVEAIVPLVLRLLPEGSPHNRIGRWCVAQALEEGPHIEPCATHYQGKAAVSIEALDLIDSLAAIQSCIKRFIGIDEINQPMGNTLALLWNWLIRPNIHTTIDLPGVCCEHLGLESLCHLDRDAALPHSSRSNHHDNRLETDLRLGETTRRSRWNGHHDHPTRPNSLASSSVERRKRRAAAMRTGHNQPFLHPIVNQLLNFWKGQGASGTHRSMAGQ